MLPNRPPGLWAANRPRHRLSRAPPGPSRRRAIPPLHHQEEDFMSSNTGMPFIRGLLLALCVLVAMLGGTPPAAEALSWEWYVGAFVGGAFPMSDDVTVTRSESETFTSPFNAPSSNSFTQRASARGATYDASPVVGGKTGVCPGFFPYLCVELDFDYFQPTLGAQTTAGRTTESSTSDGSQSGPFTTANFAEIPRVDFSVWDLGFNLIGRFGFLPESEFPLGQRLHLYLGA